MSELKIMAVITIKKEYQHDVQTALRDIVYSTRLEEGNVSYDLHVDIQNPLKYIILEVWKSQAAINIHNEAEHFISFKKAVEGKVETLVVNVVKEIY